MRKHIDAHEQEYIEETSEDGYGYRNLKLVPQGGQRTGSTTYTSTYAGLARRSSTTPSTTRG